MSSLFIIGNGFDMAHGLKTSYEDFHKYLEDEYPEAESVFQIPNYYRDGDGKEVADDNVVVGLIEYILDEVEGEKWSNLESSLGKIEFENYIEDYEHDEEDDDDFFHEAYFNEGSAMLLINPILAIPDYFDKWISTISLENIKQKKDFINLINKNDDLFLSFNYTKTLESVYKIKNVCHIHGVQGEKLFFGHGSDYSYFSDDNYGVNPGTEESFQKMQDALKKDTSKAIESHKDFFDKVEDCTIDKIYSYGFSFGEVDRIYIKEICKKIDTKTVTWYLNAFDKKDVREKYKKVLYECGFEGTVSLYNIEK